MSERSETRILLGYNQFLCAESLAAGGSFSLSLFEDLNKLIEAVVLYDKVVVLGHYRLPSGLLATPLEKAGILQTLADPEVGTLVAKPTVQHRFYANLVDVFGDTASHAHDASPEQLLQLRISPNWFDQSSYNDLFEETIACSSEDGFDRRRFTGWIGRNIFDTRENGGHFYYLARAILYGTLAEEAGMDYAPDLLRLPIAALSYSQGSRTLPKLLYDALVEKVHSEVDALAMLGMPVAVFVPPLTAKLLSSVDSPNRYPEGLLEIREKFSGFRTAYGEFLASLKDPSLTLQQKIEAKRKMISSITGIIEQGQSRHALNVRTIWDKLVSSSLDAGGVSTNLSLSGMVSLLLDQLATERAKGHARALFDLWTDTLNLKDYGHLVERAFKTEIGPLEVEHYTKYSAAIRRLLTCAQHGTNPDPT